MTESDVSKELLELSTVPLARLIYRSQSVAEFVSNDELATLEKEAVANNEEKGITGLLVLSGNRFIQVLEGDSEVVTDLFIRIFADSRHKAVELVSYALVSSRLFGDWNMRLVDLHNLGGERRTLMSGKYSSVGADVEIPRRLELVYAFLFDAAQLCEASPWRKDA